MQGQGNWVRIMALTPVDIVHTEFRSALKGYKKSQVDEFVKNVMDTLEQSIKEKQELQRSFDTLKSEHDKIKRIESTLAETLVVAQRAADEIKANAHKTAELIIAEAEQAKSRISIEAQIEIERNRSEIAILQSSRKRFQSDFQLLLTSYLNQQPFHQEIINDEIKAA